MIRCSLPQELNQEGLPLKDLHGNADNPIVIAGPESGAAAVFTGRSCCNTVQLDNASYITVRHLTLDGLDIPFVDAVNSRNTTHHITVEDLLIVNHGGAQGTVGVSTKGPAWDWIIRNNVILGAGTGMYLGNSDGNLQFVRGVIEYNVILDTLGYNMQIKHQNPRPTDIGMPTGNNKTIIRHNVFSKANNASTGGSARPNLLVGHWPLSGTGSNDLYEIYGNFLYQNTSEALFQGEGNIAFYNNVLVNDYGSALNVQAHNDVPREINIFHNTVVASGNGIRVRDVHTDYQQHITANAVFAGTSVATDTGVVIQENITDSHAASGNYVNNPSGAIGVLDLYPVAGMLASSPLDMTSLEVFTDSDKDFNGVNRDGSFRGAYAGEGQNPGWLLQLETKPNVPTSIDPVPVPVPDPAPVPDPDPLPGPVPVDSGGSGALGLVELLLLISGCLVGIYPRRNKKRL